MQEVLAECTERRRVRQRLPGGTTGAGRSITAPPPGVHLSGARQPAGLPGLRERWPHVAATLRKAPALKIVPMLASLGCPYTCAFCIDSTVEHQPFGPEQMREDLQFLLTKVRRPRVAWHDPNFAVRFDETMDAIEAAVPPGRIDFIAESSLSLLSEARLPRLARNGFQALLPGVESWFSLGNKSRTGKSEGLDKVRQVADHVNMVMRHVPYVQANFVLGLDTDEGDEPFELTKRFVDLAPGVFPGYSLLSAFGRAAPLNLELQRAGRVLPFPHHFLNNNLAMNVRPMNYEWAPFYDRVIDLVTYTFSKRNVARRFAANRGAIPSVMNVVRALSSEGAGRRRYYTEVRRLLGRRRVGARVFRGGAHDAADLLSGARTAGSRAALGGSAGGSAEPRSDGVPQGGDRAGGGGCWSAGPADAAATGAAAGPTGHHVTLLT